MRRYLLVALWPAGITAIAAATVISARRARISRSPAATHGRSAPGGAGPADSVDQAGRDSAKGSGAAENRGDCAAGVAHAAAGPGAYRWLSKPTAGRDWVPGLIELGAISCAGGALSYGVMALLGPTVVNHGPTIDEPIVSWTTSHQVNWWAAVMQRLDKIGHTWTTWGAAGTAAVCLGVTWREHRWLPPAALGAAIVVDHYATLAIRHTFGRPGPPGSPGGTYPSGGCDRVVLFYGLIAHMLWREFSGSRFGKTYAIGAVTALSFNQAYTRQYLSKHWFTDIISGLLYGSVLLGPFIAAVRLIAGPPDAKADQDRAAPTTMTRSQKPRANAPGTYRQSLLLSRIGHMASRIGTKVLSAAAVALIVELTDLALDQIGLSEEKFHILRKILKAGIGAASGALLGKVSNRSE